MAENKKKTWLESTSLYAWCAVISAAPLTCLTTDLFVFRDQASSWMTMRIMAAQLLIDGKILYQDFFEWTQPVVFELTKLLLAPLALAQFFVSRETATTIMPPDVVVSIWIILFALACGAITISLARHTIETENLGDELNQEIRRTLLAYVTGFAIATLLVRFEFGDLQHLFATALCPWIFMRWLQSRARQVPKRLSTPISLVTGLTACFDLPFLAVILVMELFWIFNEKPSKSIFHPSLTTLLVVPCIYTTMLLVSPTPFWSDFWLQAMPVKWLSYFSEYTAIFSPISTPHRTDILYCMGLAIVLSQLAGGNNTLGKAMSMLALLGFSIFILENNGLSRDLVLTVYGTTTALTLLLVNASEDISLVSLKGLMSLVCKPLTGFGFNIARFRPEETALLSLAVAASIYAVVGMADTRLKIAEVNSSDLLKNPETLRQALSRRTNTLDKVAIIVDGPQPAYPALVLADRRPDSFFLYARPMLVLDFFNSKDKLTPELKQLKKRAYNHLSRAFQTSAEAGIVVSDDYPQVLLRQEGVWEVLAKNYERKTICVYSSTNGPPFEYVGFNWPMPFFERRSKL